MVFDAVLRLFGEKVSDARKQYRTFVEKGIVLGKREDLIGGGLIRSHGGWDSVKAMRRAKIFEKADERSLGDGDFVKKVLAAAEEKMKRRYAIQAKGVNLDSLAERVAEIFDMPVPELWKPGKHRWRVQAKSVLCYWANRKLEVSIRDFSSNERICDDNQQCCPARGENCEGIKYINF